MPQISRCRREPIFRCWRRKLTYWLGLHDPAEQFGALPAFESLPPRVQQAWRQNPGLRLSASGQLDRQMLNAIVEQRITQTEAFRTLGWVLRKYGSPAPSTGLGHQPEGMRVYPSARTLATFPPGIGIGRALIKAATMPCTLTLVPPSL